MGNIKSKLNSLVNNPTFEEWKSYIKSKPTYSKIQFNIAIIFDNCSIAKQFMTENSLDVDEYQKYKPSIPNKSTATIVDELEYKAALSIYERAILKVDEFGDANSLAVGELIRIVLQELMVSELMVKNVTPDSRGDKDVRLERLLAQAEIKNYILNAVVYPDGKPISILQSDRIKEIEELKTIYEEIKLINSEYVVPDLPSVVGYTTNKQGGVSASGGCYVATAIYGSYDCPQVWTLRRFRDFTLAESWCGRAFIRTYYAISPTLVKWFGNNEWFKNMWKPTLDRMVNKLNSNGVSDKPYNDYPW